MLTYFINPSTGSDSRTGAQAQAASTPWQTLAHAIATITMSDSVTIVLQPGVYRELCTLTLTPTNVNTLLFIGDVHGNLSSGAVAPGEVRWSGWLTNDSTAPSSSAGTLNLNGKSWVTFQNILFDGSKASQGCINAAAGSANINILDCEFDVQIGGGSGVIFTGTASTAANWTIDRCRFVGLASNGIFFSVPQAAADYALNFTVKNTKFFGWGTQINISATGTGAGGAGGILLDHCTFLWASSSGIHTGTGTYGTTTGNQVVVQNCVAAMTSTVSAIAASAANQIIDGGANVILGQAVGNFTFVTSPAINTVNPRMHWGHELVIERMVRECGMPTADSPLLGIGTTSMTYDLENRPRPSGGATGPNASNNLAVGALERHDTGTKSTTTTDGGVGASIVVQGTCDHEIRVPVDATSTTISIKVEWDANYGGGTLPQLVLVADPETGVSTQTVTATGSSGSFNTITLAAFTPSAKGVVRLRLVSSAAANGFVYWDTLTGGATGGTGGMDYFHGGQPLNVSVPAPSGAAATAYSVYGSTAADIDEVLTFFIVPNGSFTGTINFADSPVTGTFTPTSLSWAASSAIKSFTYHSHTAGTETLSFTNTASLTDQSNLSLVLSAPSTLTLSQLQGELTSRGATSGFFAGTAGGVNIVNCGGASVNAAISGNLPVNVQAMASGVIHTSNIDPTLAALLLGEYLLSTGVTTGPVTADVYRRVGFNANLPYYESMTLGTPVFLWSDGTFYYMTTTNPGAGLPAGYYKTASGATRVGPYTAQGTASGTPPTVTPHGVDVTEVNANGADPSATVMAVDGSGNPLATAASQTSILNAVNGITSNTARSKISCPTWLARPATGSTVYEIDVNLYAFGGALEDPDSSTVTVHARNSAGSSLDAALGSTTMTRIALGRYKVTYTVNSTDTTGEVILDFSWTLNSGAIAMATSEATQIEDAETIATLAAIKAQTDQLQFSGNNVKSAPQTDSPGTATLLARITGSIAPTTGDPFARLGAPANGSVSADIAAVKTDTAQLTRAQGLLATGTVVTGGTTTTLLVNLTSVNALPTSLAGLANKTVELLNGNALWCTGTIESAVAVTGTEVNITFQPTKTLGAAPATGDQVGIY